MSKTAAILGARLIFGGVFAIAAAFKFLGIGATAGYIAAAGFPLALPLAWIAAFFESALAIALWTGAFFSEAALLAAAYVLFLAFAFHGPSHWSGNQTEFGFFVDHFTFIAGLLFAAVRGPGGVLVVRRSIIWRPQAGHFSCSWRTQLASTIFHAEFAQGYSRRAAREFWGWGPLRGQKHNAHNAQRQQLRNDARRAQTNAS